MAICSHRRERNAYLKPNKIMKTYKEYTKKFLTDLYAEFSEGKRNPFFYNENDITISQARGRFDELSFTDSAKEFINSGLQAKSLFERVEKLIIEKVNKATFDFESEDHYSQWIVTCEDMRFALQNDDSDCNNVKGTEYSINEESGALNIVQEFTLGLLTAQDLELLENMDVRWKHNIFFEYFDSLFESELMKQFKN